ncbi:histidyl-tRNA synthetase [Cryptobacterium curtum DSM 15641]|uniref:Histidine--tRNA ligase n=1 Tax=Cryptobacterium curtum (strain ATCC 700683 / DSM 15641 / CCUG 43107 / 12-3) TaxID=469378 RepID=C7MMM6_CRYCD|nr:histidine--tRNA ligase [Cryptobacterium curtum]ACU94166.1 histidyl-tRNA synthetase [Cryptobacterium curtum DSM 15641]
MAIQRPKGTEDLLAGKAIFYRHFVDTAFEVFGRYGYVPIEVPTFEQTDLFVRGLGTATDVVSKEMFTAISGENLKSLLAGETVKPESRFSLRPEGTAGVVRAVAQNNLVAQGSAPVKLMYAGPMFRAERPQKGRLREFHQVGIECLGASAPSVDAEGIIMLMRFYERIGIPRENMRLLLNSMGDHTCRPAYREAVRTYIMDHASEMCDECVRRADINPLRSFDCKNPDCQRVMANAPIISDWLCDDCKSHYNQVKAYLDAAGIEYVEDPSLVRGLDYYTRTVFEIQVVDGMGSQSAIGGGGRYDGLMEEIGGKSCPGFGFALGFERCVLALTAAGVSVANNPTCTLFIACVDDAARSQGFILAQTCRDAGVAVEIDHQSRSLKSQFKLADKLGAVYVAVLGPDEVAAGVAKVRDMASHEEQPVSFAEVAHFVSHGGVETK